ncbi:MAG: DNA polymerase III subunit beta [Planctomycetota bacterium JB042]
MRIVCHREALLNGVSIASSVAPSRSTRPILSGVKISAKKKQSVALATDLEIAVCARLAEVIVEREGEVVLTAHTLVEILRSIEAAEVTIDCEGRKCRITSEDAEYELVTDDPTDFPEIGPAGRGGVSVPRGFLEEMFQRTAFAAARDVGRYAINGVLVEVGGGEIRFVATDGRRLAVAVRALPDATSDTRRAIVPVKALQECLRGSEGEETVRVLIEDARIVFSSESADIAAKPVEGDFPDYEAVVPQESLGRAEVARGTLYAAIKKASVMSGDEMRAIQISIHDGKIEVTAQVEGRGAAKTSIEAEIEGDDDVTVDFNPDYVADFLKPLPNQTVAFEFRDGNGAGVFRVEDSDDLYVVMPITTS